jgi:hypothetical protein
MGAWGPGAFENDDAGDWVYDLEGADDLALVRDALEEAVQVSGYLDLGEGARAVAAAEVLAVASGRPGAAGVPDDVAAWLDAVTPAVSDDDRSLARRALERVVGPRSEITELWAEASDGAAWRSSIDELTSRLQ